MHLSEFVYGSVHPVKKGNISRFILLRQLSGKPVCRLHGYECKKNRQRNGEPILFTGK